MQRTGFAAAALLAACTIATPPGLELDVGRVCEDIAIEVADPDVLPGSELHAAAIPSSGADAAWYLATDPHGALELRRVPGDMPAIDLSALGEPDDFRVQPGPIEGQVWLALDRPEGARVWRIDETTEAVREGAALAFPDAEAGWIRRVVFLGQTPHLVAVPRASKAGVVPIHLAALTPELALGEAWALTATAKCAPLSELACPLFWDDLRDVAVLDSAEAGSISGAALLLAITTQGDPDPIDPEQVPVFETQVISVVLQRDAGAERPVLTRRDHVSWTSDGPVVPFPAQLAADPLGLYVVAGLIPGPDTSGAAATMSDYLFRADLLGAGTADAGDVIALLPKVLGSHLLQLGGRVALGQLSGRTWNVAPIEGLTINESIVGSLAVDADATVLRAGRGQFVVVADAAPSRRARIACAAATSSTGE